MTSKGFRKIALALKGTVENSHMNHPDFRVAGKIFASLTHDELKAMAKLTPEQQQEFMQEDLQTFLPEAGAWGRNGCTKILLASADDVGRALTLARQNAVYRGVEKNSRKI